MTTNVDKSDLSSFSSQIVNDRMFYGFAPEGPQRAFIVRGMVLPRDKRDQFRLGVDDVINRFRPRPHHARIAVTYVPGKNTIIYTRLYYCDISFT